MLKTLSEPKGTGTSSSVTSDPPKESEKIDLSEKELPNSTGPLPTNDIPFTHAESVISTELDAQRMEAERNYSKNIEAVFEAVSRQCRPL